MFQSFPVSGCSGCELNELVAVLVECRRWGKCQGTREQGLQVMIKLSTREEEFIRKLWLYLVYRFEVLVGPSASTCSLTGRLMQFLLSCCLVCNLLAKLRSYCLGASPLSTIAVQVLKLVLSWDSFFFLLCDCWICTAARLERLAVKERKKRGIFMRS